MISMFRVGVIDQISVGTPLLLLSVSLRQYNCEQIVLCFIH